MHCVWEFLMQEYGKLASVAGLVLTCWVLVAVKNITRDYILKGRLPSLVKRMDELSSQLSIVVWEFDENQADISETFKKLLSNLEALKRIIPRKYQQAIAPMITSLQAYNVDLDDGERAQRLSIEFQKCREDIRNMTEDMQWRR